MDRAPRIDVVRAVAASPDLKAQTDESLGTLVIRFSPFNTWYEVHSFWEGDFMERTVAGAFAQTIAEDGATMRSLFNHGNDPSIGDKVLGPIVSLSEEKDGPVGEVELLDTSYNRDLLPGLKKKLYGASMRMRVLADAWDDEPGVSSHNPKGLPERTIQRTRTMEFGPVTFPASPTASADMRSMTDSYYDGLRERDVSAFEAAVRAAGRQPSDFTGRPDARSTGGGVDEAVNPHAARIRDRVLRMTGILT